MKFTEGQKIAQECLAANPAFAGLDIFVELDDRATPEELADYDRRFEEALNTKGLAVIVMLPYGLKLDEAKARGASQAGGIIMEMVYPVAFCENETINRGAANPAAVPPSAPANKLPLTLMREAIRSLLRKFTFPTQALGRPEFGDGFWAYYIFAQRPDTILAST
jgi:hypothetical protein